MLFRVVRISLLVMAMTAPAGAWRPLAEVDGEWLTWPADERIPLGEGGPIWDSAAEQWAFIGPVGFAPVPDPGLAIDGIIALDADPDQWAAAELDPDLIAFTTISDDGARIVDADVQLNTGRFRFSAGVERGAWDLQTVYTHELGHALGLGHSCGEGAGSCDADSAAARAVMAERVPLGERREAGDDDRAGIEALYPRRPWARPAVVDIVPDANGWTIEAEVFGRDGDVVRAWSDGALVELQFADERLVGDLTADTAAFWSVTGQVEVRSLPVYSVDAGVEPPVAAPPTPEGCSAGGGRPPSPLWFLLMLPALRSARTPRGLDP